MKKKLKPATTPATLAHLARIDPLICIMAAERVPSALRDDAAQEARIAVWEVAEKHANDPKPLHGLLTVVARRAVTGVANGRPMTGEARRQGIERDPLRSRTAVELDPARDDSAVRARTDEIEQRADVARALATLTPGQRYYVTEHFLRDRTHEDVARELGVTVEFLEDLWRQLRPVLAEALGGAA